MTVRLLKEGEIGAAGFLALTYPDVVLHPIESRPEYVVETTAGAADAAIALARRLDAGLGDRVKQTIDSASNGTLVPAEDQLALAEEVEHLRLNKHVQLQGKQATAWQSWLAFWRGRVAGTRTMFDATTAFADQLALPIVVMNIGAAHTSEMVKRLNDSKRPYAVVSALAQTTNNHAGDLEVGFDRKYRHLSVFTDGFLTSALLDGHKKPEPEFNDPWFRAKAETYLLVDAVVSRVLTSESAGGGPPFGFSKGDLQRSLTSIDPSQISVISNGPNGQAVLFPLRLAPFPHRKVATIWVKAALGTARSPSDSVEDLLQTVLAQIQQEPDAPTNVEDAAHQIQVSTRAVATFGSDRATVSRRLLSSV